MSKIEIKPANVIESYLGLDYGGEIHQWFTNTCALHMDDYVPYRHGDLAKTVVENNVVNSDNVTEDTITYKQPYASYVYYGMRNDKSHVILWYTTDTHLYAGPYWDKLMWSAEKQEVIKEVQDYINTRGKK